MPILNNIEWDAFDRKRAHYLFTYPEKQKILINQLKQWLAQNQFDGINIDFENLTEDDLNLLSGFLKRFSTVLHAAGIEVSVDVEAGAAAKWKEIAQQSDFIMAYDEHYTSEAGPIASMSWYTGILKKAIVLAPPGQDRYRNRELRL